MSAGGGIYGENLVITNSTISNNKSAATNNISSFFGGGGIFGGGIIRNSTISGNSHNCYANAGVCGLGLTAGPERYAGGVMGTFIISNTIVAMNGFDVSGGITSEGYNLIGNVGTSTGWLSTDILNQDPKLAPLANNGGLTQTQALLPGSPAINAGNNANASATDQRGFARIVGGIIDIGAFESNTPCNFTINSNNQSVSSSGGNIIVNVTAVTGCSRSAVSNSDWISVTSGSNGDGNGTVTLSVQANTGPARTGTVTIAGQTFTVNQSSGCSFIINPATQSFTASGGNGSTTVTTVSGCAYSSVSNDSWITVTEGVSGSGNGTVSFTVTANTGVARIGTLFIAGQTFTVNQAAYVKSRKRVRFF